MDLLAAHALTTCTFRYDHDYIFNVGMYIVRAVGMKVDILSNLFVGVSNQNKTYT